MPMFQCSTWHVMLFHAYAFHPLPVLRCPPTVDKGGTLDRIELKEALLLTGMADVTDAQVVAMMKNALGGSSAQVATGDANSQSGGDGKEETVDESNLDDLVLTFDQFKQMMAEARAAEMIQKSFKKIKIRRPSQATHSVFAAAGLFKEAGAAHGAAKDEKGIKKEPKEVRIEGKEAKNDHLKKNLGRQASGSSNETKGGAAGTNKASAAIKAEKTREALKKGKKLFTAAEEIAAREEQEREWERVGMQEWTKWIAKIGLAQLVMEALKVSFKEGELVAFEYMKSRDREQVAGMLEEAQLSGLTDIIMDGISGLQGQAAPSGAALNNKFQKTGKFTMGCAFACPPPPCAIVP